MKHLDENYLGGKGLFGLLLHITVHHSRKSEQELWRQELMQKAWRGAAYWLILHDLLSVLSYRTQDHQPKDSTPHHELGPLTSVIN